MDRRYKRLGNIFLIWGTLIMAFALFVYFQIFGPEEMAICFFSLSVLMILPMVRQMQEDVKADARRRIILERIRKLPGADFTKKLTYDLVELPGILVESDRSGAFIVKHGKTIDSFCCFDVSAFDCYMASGRPVMEITFRKTTLVVEGEK